ncbi:SIR2 family protein [Rhodoplanes azumiensis]|uniref:SIR2 family protein n=1 Tax=Rhodoplanes azumiensis TaxID=1897628 RepID=A0ABW5AKM0_9BRAD
MKIDPTYLDELKPTLLAGRYSLFLGAGASCDSFDSKLAALPTGDALRKQLVKLKELKENSSLSRAYAQLSDDEVLKFITERFANCTPGPTANKLPGFFWNRIYTLNVDNVIEASYKTNKSNQHAIPFTHKSLYRNPEDVNSLQIVHIHGWAGKPDDGYVFSLPDYVRNMGPGNPWIDVLAQTIATEPFIIAGTSLEEPDLEYFLTNRTPSTVRRDRGPSFLIEPFPDPGTLRDCERHGLILYPGTLLEFFAELDVAFPTRPFPASAAVGFTEKAFNTKPNNKDLALFSRDFAFIVAKQEQENADLGFYVGREPALSDISLNRDASRRSTSQLKTIIKSPFERGRWNKNFLIVDDVAGGGKSTVLGRLAFDLSAEGFSVFSYRNLGTPDINLSARIFNNLIKPFIVFCDNFADHAPAMTALYREIHRDDFLIVGFERSYRIQYAIQTLAGNEFDRVTLQKFDSAEARELIDKMHFYGLTTDRYKPEQAEPLSKELVSDPIAIAVCRVMNDFRPVERILDSLFDAADENRVKRYLACALASYCYKPGLAYPILVAAFPAENLRDQIDSKDILPLDFFDRDRRDYLLPTNPVLGQRFLRRVSETDESFMLEVYSSLGAHLAPYVNRTAIIKRTPEARLGSRLFDFDEVVSGLLPSKSENFFLNMRRFWSWNSRYWEQFALLKLDQYAKSNSKNKEILLDQALSHAKHAVQVERHPLPLTTLGKVFFEEMKHRETRFSSAFKDGLNAVSEAFKLEGRMNRIAIHPFFTGFSGANHYLKNGGKLDGKQAQQLRDLAESAERFFSYDTGLMVLLREVQRFLRADPRSC